MSLDQDDYRWRETYFVLFDAKKRPRAEALRRVLGGLNRRFQFTHEAADEGDFESMTIVSPQDYAAIDISYLAGEEIEEQAAILAKEMSATADTAADRRRIQGIQHCNARFDIMHFAQVTDDDDGEDEMLDPSALLAVLEALADLTDGVGIDPQSGALLR